MDKIAVLIPCYNEAKTVGKVVTDFRAALPEAAIYVYSNNSTDDTARIAAEAGAIVRQEYQQGKGNVVRRMFQEIDAQCYLLVDGDDTYPAQAAAELVEPVLLRQTDMVVGDRLSSTYFTENKRPFHNTGNTMVRFSINSIFGSNVQDIMTGYRAMSRRFVKSFPVISKGFEIETEMTIHAIAMNMSLENRVIDYRDRPEGSESKLNTFRDGFKVIRTIFNLFRNYKPLAFFCTIAAILLLFAAAFFFPMVWLPYRQTGLVEHFPTLIVCGFIAIAAVLSVFTGMILDAIRQKERREFEFRLTILMELSRLEEQENRGSHLDSTPENKKYPTIV